MPAWRLCPEQAQPCWGAAAGEPVLFSRLHLPGRCLATDALELQDKAKAPSHPVTNKSNVQATQWRHVSLLHGTSLFGDRGSWRALTALALESGWVWALDVLHQHYNSHPCPLSIPPILSLPLVVVLSFWLFTDIKYCCHPAGVYDNWNSQLLVAQRCVRVRSMTFPAALLSCVDSHPGFSPELRWSRAQLRPLLVRPEIQAQYLLIKWLVIYEVKYIKFHVNLAANWNCLGVVVRENFFSVTACLQP